MAVEPTIQLPSRYALQRVLGGNDDIYPFLELGTLEMFTFDDDFEGGTIKVGYTTTVSGAGSTALALVAGNTNGMARMESGTADAGRSAASRGLHLRGELNAGIAVRMQLSAITSVKAEIGFNDALAPAGGIVNVKATPSFTATDGCCWIIDTTNNANWEGLGVQNGTAATTIAAAIAPVAATYEWLVIALNGTTAHYMRLNTDGKLTYGPTAQTNAVRAAIDLTPWIMVQARTGSANRQFDIDRMFVWQRRTVADP